MTALNAFLLFFGMALLGVPLGFGIVSALVGPIVVRILPEHLWDDVMFLILNGGAAATTFLIGYLALDLPLWVSLLVAFLIAMTSYTRRVTEPEYDPVAAAMVEAAFYEPDPAVTTEDEPPGRSGPA